MAQTFRYTWVILGLLACLFAGIAPVYTQKATVKITSFDEAGNRLGAVFIAVDKKTVNSTNSQGEAIIEVTPGTHEFRFTSSGREPVKMERTVTADELLVLTPIMELSLIDIGPTEIIEERDRKLPIQTFDPENIRTTMGVGDQVIMMIKSGGLGVMSNNELSSGYNVRGGNFDENIIYVNDIEVYRPFLARSGQQEGLSFINGDMVESIKFSSGGFEAKYGDKMASVLDIKYNRPTKFRANVAGSLLGVSLHVEDAMLKNRLKYNLGFRYRSNNYLLSALDTKGEYKPNFLDFQGTIGYDITDKWELSFFGAYSDNNYITIPSTRETIFGHVQEAKQLTIYFDGQEKTRYRVGMGAMTLLFRPKNQEHKFIASGYHTQESEKFDILGQYFLGEVESDLGSDNFGQVKNTVGIGGFLNHARNELQATVYAAETKSKIYVPFLGRILQGVTYQFGVRYSHERIYDRIHEWNILDSSGYLLPYNGPTDNSEISVDDFRKAVNELQSNRAQGYFQTAIAWERDSHFVNLTFGVRANYWDLNNELLISPRVQLAWQPNFRPNKKTGVIPDLLFRLSGGIYYQAPFYRELRRLDATVNLNIKSQRSYQAVLGLDYNFRIWGRPFKFVTEVYYKYIENLIPYELDNVRIRYYGNNDATGYATGIDMKLNGQFIPGLESWITMSVLKTEEDIKNDAYTDQNGNLIEPGYIPRPTDQRFSLGLFFQDNIPKLEWMRVHLNLLFGSQLPFGPPNDVRYTDTLRAPFYRRVDIGFSFVFIGKESMLDMRKAKELKEGITKERKIEKVIKSLWFSFDIFNLLDINNTVSYFWIRDVNNRQYAVPNYLTPRLFNVKLVAQF